MLDDHTRRLFQKVQQTLERQSIIIKALVDTHSEVIGKANADALLTSVMYDLQEINSILEDAAKGVED